MAPRINIRTDKPVRVTSLVLEEPMRKTRAEALRNAQLIEKYWREVKRRDDIQVWVSFSSESHLWEIYSNLVNGWPRPIKGVRARPEAGEP